MRRILFVALFVFCLGFGSATVIADMQSHRRVAEELAQVLQIDRLLQQSYEQMLDVQVQANPDLKPYRDVMLDFFRKHMTWDALKDDLLNLYAEHFSESEMQELNAFYSTETGQKSISAIPDIMRRAGEIGVKRVQENLPELERMLQQKESTAQ